MSVMEICQCLDSEPFYIGEFALSTLECLLRNRNFTKTFFWFFRSKNMLNDSSSISALPMLIALLCIEFEVFEELDNQIAAQEALKQIHTDLTQNVKILYSFFLKYYYSVYKSALRVLKVLKKKKKNGPIYFCLKHGSSLEITAKDINNKFLRLRILKNFCLKSIIF